MATETKKPSLWARACRGIGSGIGHVTSAATVAAVTGVCTGTYNVTKGAVQGGLAEARKLRKSVEERTQSPQLLARRIKRTTAALVSCSLGLEALKKDYLPLAQQVKDGNHDPSFLSLVSDKRKALKREERRQKFLQGYLELLQVQQETLVQSLTDEDLVLYVQNQKFQ